MAHYDVTLKDRTVERVAHVDAYQQEGQMTTFFRTASARQVVDTWSTRVASFRTSEVSMIRRIEVDGDVTVAPEVAAELGALDDEAVVTPFVRTA